jgi:peptidoglycan/LPS O-acetylase OafA/YrhL
MKRPRAFRLLLAVVVGGFGFALVNWLSEGSWHFLGAVVGALLVVLLIYGVDHYDAQLRNPRRLRRPGRRSRDAGGSTE